MSGTILIVDDMAINRMILEAKLTEAYFDVLQAESGKEALAKVVECQPDLVLLDVLMDDMDGFTVCRKIKDNPETAHIPVVMVTALTNQQDRLRGLESGADDFLTKPINDLALLSRVRNLLRAKFMFDELRLRDSTSRALGLDDYDPGRSLDLEGGSAVLVPGSAEAGRQWVRILGMQRDFTWTEMTDGKAVLDLRPEELPDVFMVHAKLAGGGDGLRLVSHLHSRPMTRHCGIILVVPEGQQETAAKGLDIGASDYLYEPLDPPETIMRIKGQIRRKHISDRLRANVNDTLRLAVQDPLTGLYNRRYALQHLARISEKARRSGKSFTVMLLDIDKFKRINDQFGHAAGDHVLCEFAHRLQENLRGVDLVSRIGGEEFLVAMPETNESQARRAAERLRRIIGQTPFDLPPPANCALHVTVSIGVVMGNAHSQDIDLLLRHADEALYASKNDGRDMVTLFSSAA